jgi:surface antigen
MGFRGTALVACALFGVGSLAVTAEAAQPERRQASSVRTQQASASHRVATHEGSGGLSCVPYVRQVTGMQVTGNGWEWWGNAAGSYARGHRPEPGSVLAFRSTGNMRYGHVAVVSEVLGSRHVLIDHANWAGPGIRRGTVTHGVHVVDVSPANDWTDVRVQVGRGQEDFGRSYPTYGFIYNRPDNTQWAAQGPASAEPGQIGYEEVADASGPEEQGPRAGRRSGTRHAGR